MTVTDSRHRPERSKRPPRRKWTMRMRCSAGRCDQSISTSLMTALYAILDVWRCVDGCCVFVFGGGRRTIDATAVALRGNGCNSVEFN
ncbi:hypothetical protein Trydic_g10181 [Trypoxylus dichotomus]